MIGGTPTTWLSSGAPGTFLSIGSQTNHIKKRTKRRCEEVGYTDRKEPKFY